MLDQLRDDFELACAISSRILLVQEVVVADLLPEVEHRHDVAYGEHVSAGVPEKRALLPHGHNNTSYIRGQPGE